MTTIELTEAQWQALQAEHEKPVEVVDPATQRRYVLLAREQFERVRALLEAQPVRDRPGETSDIPPGILRSEQAFWRDLPQLLKTERNLGKWVCYHGDERIGIADTDKPLIRECLRRSLPDDQYDLLIIRPRDLRHWEPEEVEPLGPWHFDDVPPHA
jgi:hypothetical protein